MSACLTAVTESVPTVKRLIEHFSSWHRLKKAVAVFMRLKAILRKQRLARREKSTSSQDLVRSPIIVNEMEEAEIVILRFTQTLSFPNKIKSLNKTNYASDEYHKKIHAYRWKPNTTKTGVLYRLDPFSDKKRILRVGGRLNNTDITEDSRHLTILPRKSHVTTLIIRHTHEQLGNVGRRHVLARLREKYWIVGANSAVRQVVSACVTCRRNTALKQDQKMADLPSDRLTAAPPFTCVGVDYFGPHIIKEGRKECKRYGALFTCLASRAAHVEIAHSLETDCFLKALRRFVARRGPVREIRCDNGTNFLGARRELREAIEEMDHDEISAKLGQQQIDWKCNPPSASHMSGVWERQIYKNCAKHSLYVDA